jgi:hypothetical protein
MNRQALNHVPCIFHSSSCASSVGAKASWPMYRTKIYQHAWEIRCVDISEFNPRINQSLMRSGISHLVFENFKMSVIWLLCHVWFNTYLWQYNKYYWDHIYMTCDHSLFAESSTVTRRPMRQMFSLRDHSENIVGGMHEDIWEFHQSCCQWAQRKCHMHNFLLFNVWGSHHVCCDHCIYATTIEVGY